MSKRLQLLESFRDSGNKPEWMVMTVLPVLPLIYVRWYRLRVVVLLRLI